MSLATVINFGSLNLDHVYQVKDFVRPGETLASSHYQQFVGGKGCNQSIALAKAGAKVMHAGKIGSDGHAVKSCLDNKGVDTSLISQASAATGHAIIQVAVSGENAILLAGGANQQIKAEDIDRVMAVAQAGDYLLIQNEINALGLIIDAAVERSMTVVFNPSPISSDLHHYPLHKVDYFILNEIEAEMLSGQQQLDAILTALVARYPQGKFILTLGARGAVYCDAREQLSVPAELVTPVDTTAAGDTFAGFFLAELIRGSSIKVCMTLACKAAALCVQRRGAAESIPDYAALR